MKRFQLFSLASAMLLASAAGFTSCSSDSEDPLDGGSGVAGQVVKTQFVINIPYAGNESGGNARVSTRMTADNTQNNNNFLGLKDIEMFAYNEVPSETNPTSTRTIRIGTRNASNSDNYRRIYSDIAIPVGTKNMILYARATRTKTVTSGSTNKTNFEAGSLTNPYGNFKDDAKPNLSELNFNLEAIHKKNDFDTYGQAILQKLNTIANTTSKGKKWSETGTDETADNDDKILHTLYGKFIKLTAGSANSVNSFINHLKTAIESQGVKTEMANAIIANCDEVSGDFPRGLSLPDGVVRVKFDDATNSFTFETATAGTTTTGSNLIDYKTVTYPSELAYFVSSPIRTSTTDKSKVGDLPSYKDWLAGTTNAWDGYGDIVQNNTLFVALQNPVQYGVACLKSSIKYSGTSLEDNAKEKIGSESNNFITVNDKSFPITGILIGGQPAGVKWDFEPNSTTKPADFKYTIYDKDMNGGNTFTAKAADTETLPYNYTLVLDNKDTSSDGATQSNVNVVIELENNAADFYGADGLIPKGSKFYLAGTLDLSKYNQTEDGKTLDHVFIKDHTTVANFTIKDLKKAYNCIPDLRTSKINVGLAVDLSWQKGIKFDVEL